MSVFTRDRLHPLLHAGPGPCLSIFVPTQPRHPEATQGPVRFKNALREAERLLADRHSAREIEPLLAPVAALSDVDFWRRQTAGLAVFRSSERLEHYWLPVTPPELVVAADTFHVRPLLRCLQANLRYFVLALSQSSPAVYEGTSASLAEVRIPGLPAALAESAAGAKEKKGLTAHPTSTGGGARAVHGAGGTEPSAKEDLARYFRAIDRAVATALQAEPAPVILAGVAYYHPIYREITRLKGLAEQAVEGSPDAMTPEELQAAAWPIAEAALRRAEQAALEEYGRGAPAGRCLEDLEDIVRAALAGRVGRLFLAQGVRVWGTVDGESGRVTRASSQQGSHDDDVLDDIAQAVLVRGGDVVTLTRERMPGGRELAALLRY